MYVKCYTRFCAISKQPRKEYKMITKDEINYDVELVENTSIDALRQAYKDYVIIWLSASGKTEDNPDGSYRFLVEVNGTTRFGSDNIHDASETKSLVHGFRHALRLLIRRSHICVIVPTAFGIEDAFMGKGDELSVFEDAFNLIKRHKSSLLEVRYLDGAEEIDKYICDKSGDSLFKRNLELKEHKKNKAISEYKTKIYKECLAKVALEMEKHEISDEVIENVISSIGAHNFA